jgi:hypothetical protein
MTGIWEWYYGGGRDLYVTCPTYCKPVPNNFNFTVCVISNSLLKCKVEHHALLYFITKLLTVLQRKQTHHVTHTNTTVSLNARGTSIYTLCTNKSNICVTGTYRNPSPTMFLHLYYIQPTSIFLLLVYIR